VAARLKLDLLILELAMPLVSGIEAVRRILKLLPCTKLLFFTVQTNPDYLHEALSDGADGYILKSSTREEIVDVVRSILLDIRVFLTGLWETISTSPNGGTANPDLVRCSLHVRGRMIQMLAEGHTAKQVASFLKLSYKTTAFHRNNLRRKL
jgi:DNA-binding NarL/FixJ family response regulator